MRHVINAGKHADNRLLSSWPHFGRTQMARYVRFDASCRYELPVGEARDVNKLFGLSFGLFGLHQNSARFGWRWNEAAGCIDLLAYCYVNGTRNWDEQMEFPVVAQVQLSEEFWACIELDWNYEEGFGYVFSVDAPSQPWREVIVPAGHPPGYGLTHSLYFGGNLPAPHRMVVEMSKKRLKNIS